MHIDPQELHAVETATAESNVRIDLYANIHKALRAMMLDTLQGVGRLDAYDDQDVATACDRVHRLAQACERHLAHENQFVHPAIEAVQPDASARIAQEHVDHLSEIQALHQGAAQVLTRQGAARARAVEGLYRQLALFAAHNFTHMQIEEVHHNHVLWQHYRDDELVAIEQRIIAAIPPQEAIETMRWMVPALTPLQRQQMLEGLRAGAPGEVFDAVIATVQPHLSTTEWAKLARGLGLAPQPGLVTV